MALFVHLQVMMQEQDMEEAKYPVCKCLGVLDFFRKQTVKLQVDSQTNSLQFYKGSCRKLQKAQLRLRGTGSVLLHLWVEIPAVKQ